MIATSANGCKDTVVKDVPIHVTPKIWVPNTFTPNGDLTNDYFYPTTYYIKEVDVTVFNRWGEIIFQSNDVNFQWDGTYKGVEVQQGVYVYMIRARGYNDEPFYLHGDVTLIR